MQTRSFNHDMKNLPKFTNTSVNYDFLVFFKLQSWPNS